MSTITLIVASPPRKSDTTHLFDVTFNRLQMAGTGHQIHRNTPCLINDLFSLHFIMFVLILSSVARRGEISPTAGKFKRRRERIQNQDALKLDVFCLIESHCSKYVGFWRLSQALPRLPVEAVHLQWLDVGLQLMFTK